MEAHFFGRWPTEMKQRDSKLIKTGTVGGQRKPESLQFGVQPVMRPVAGGNAYRPSSLLLNLERVIIAPNVFKTMLHLVLWPQVSGPIVRVKWGETYPICQNTSNNIRPWWCDCFTPGGDCGEDANFPG